MYDLREKVKQEEQEEEDVTDWLTDWLTDWFYQLIRDTVGNKKTSNKS